MSSNARLAGADARNAAAKSRFWCPATTRSRRSPRWSATSARRCRRRPSTSTTTIRPTTPPMPRARPAPWFAARAIRARATWCGACSPTSRPTSTCWSTATRPTMRRARRPWSPSSLDDRLDMVVATRIDREEAAYRRGHRTGNRLLTGVRRPRVRPRLQRHAVRLPGVLAPLRQVVSGAVRRLRDRDRADRARARARAAGRRGRDALLLAAARIGLEAHHLARRLPHPLRRCSSSIAPSGRCSFFGALGIALAIISIGLAIPIFITYVQEGLVPRLPTAVLSTGLMLLAFLSLACGLILDTVTRGRRELKLLAYLALRAPGEERRRS